MFRFSNLLIRSVFFLILLVSSLYLSWWFTGAIFLLGTLAFDWFFEGVLVLLSIDVVFYAGWVPQLALAGVVAVLLREYVYIYLQGQ